MSSGAIAGCKTAGPALAAAACGLVGCRFRLHGRDPRSGLDCVGVIAAALVATGRPASLPRLYPLRGEPWSLITEGAARCGLIAAPAPTMAGDILLFGVGPGQVHLAVAIDGTRIVQAHAGLRRVVLSTTPAEWRLLRQWRLAAHP